MNDDSAVGSPNPNQKFLDELRSLPHPEYKPSSKAWRQEQTLVSHHGNPNYVYIFGKWYHVSQLPPHFAEFHLQRAEMTKNNPANISKPNSRK